MIERVKFYGEFTPPNIGFNAQPVRIAGNGFCEFTDEGLRVQGFQDKRLTISDLVNSLVTIFFVFIFGFLLPFAWAIIIGIVIGLVWRATRPNKLGKSIDITIPWKKVISYRSSRVNEIVLRINKFKSNQGKFNGELFFCLDDPRNTLDYLDFVEELVVREIKCTSSLKLAPLKFKQ